MVTLPGNHWNTSLDFTLGRNQTSNSPAAPKRVRMKKIFMASYDLTSADYTVNCPNLDTWDLDQSGWRRNTCSRRKRQRPYRNLQTVFSRSDLSRCVGVTRIWLWCGYRERRRPRQDLGASCLILKPSLVIRCTCWPLPSPLCDMAVLCCLPHPLLMTLSLPPWAPLPLQSHPGVSRGSQNIDA